MHQRKKVIFAGMIGNALEFYDFSLYAFFTPVIAAAFFPHSEGTLVSLIYALTVYAVGFLMRPLGALFFGYLGDRYGRKKALSLSVVLMAVPTTLIGLLPTYDAIGLAAPLILMLCRLLQGLCAGGEYNGAAIFVLEHQKTQRGFAGGLITSSCAIGSLLGSAVGYICAAYDKILFIDGWRVPFLVGMIIGVVGMYIRRHLDESPVFKELAAAQALKEKTQKEKMPASPLSQALRDHPWSVACVIGVAWLNGTMYYASFQFISIYANMVFGWSVQESLPISSIALTVYALLTPFTGWLSDRVGIKKLMLPSAILTALLGVPLFLLISSANYLKIAIAQVIFATLAAFFSGPINALMQRLFPASARYTGVAFSYSVGLAVFGGFTPVIMTALYERTAHPLAPSLWVVLSALASAIVFAVIYPKIKMQKD